MSKNKELKKTLQAKLNTELIIATTAGFSGRVRRLIKKGADINFISENGETPLYIAARQGDVKIVGWLLKRGAKNNVSKDITPLHIAAIFGYFEVVELLIKGDNDINLNQKIQNQGVLDPLYLAIIHNKMNVVKLLLECGVEVLTQHIPRHIESEDLREIIKLLIPYLLLSDPSTAKLECIYQYPELSVTWDATLTQINKMQSTFISKGYTYYDLLKIDSNKLAKGITANILIKLKKVDFHENFSSFSHNFQKKIAELISLKEQSQHAELSQDNIVFFKKRSSEDTSLVHNDSTSGNLATFNR